MRSLICLIVIVFFTGCKSETSSEPEVSKFIGQLSGVWESDCGGFGQGYTQSLYIFEGSEFTIETTIYPSGCGKEGIGPIIRRGYYSLPGTQLMDSGITALKIDYYIEEQENDPVTYGGIPSMLGLLYISNNTLYSGVTESVELVDPETESCDDESFLIIMNSDPSIRFCPSRPSTLNFEAPYYKNTEL